MKKLIYKYLNKLHQQRLADKEKVIFLAMDADLFSNRPLEGEASELSRLFNLMNINSIIFSEPLEPYKTIMDELSKDDHLIQYRPMKKEIFVKDYKRITPSDSETRTFMHDIIILDTFDCEAIKRALSLRKAAIIKNRGIISQGILTPEQAYVSYSSTCFALFVKYFTDALHYIEYCAKAGINPEADFIKNLKRILQYLIADSFIERDRDCFYDLTILELLDYLSAEGKLKYDFPLSVYVKPYDEHSVIKIISEVGRIIIENRLVDSYFGNISYVLEDKIFISQTGSSLDELNGNIEIVPLEGSSISITASSELPTHRKIYLLTGDNAILHAHPLFSVIMSLYCDLINCEFFNYRENCPTTCKDKRYIASIPLVCGEIGTGRVGLVNTVPERMAEKGCVIVYGHGVFTSGKDTFLEPLKKIFEIENTCRSEYFKKMGGFLSSSTQTL
ncbi:MAG: class II aldolase/adducin family protein [Thermodesulfovibrionales bacterium]|nr:class II aldolase/adducin family protein [Thermodesulfovibrionales bacterium]